MGEVAVMQQELERLLREAEQAHADFERHLGHADDNWPAWYADYIYRRLEDPEGTGGPGSQG